MKWHLNRLGEAYTFGCQKNQNPGCCYYSPKEKKKYKGTHFKFFLLARKENGKAGRRILLKILL